jgi:hypothetical protein
MSLASLSSPCARQGLALRLASLLTALALAAAVPEEVVEYYPDGVVKARYHVDDKGRRDGPASEFFAGGSVSVRARYTAGELDGPWSSFWEDGKKRVSATYKRGQLQGEFVERGIDGEPTLVASYKAGSLDGTREILRAGRAVSRQRWKAGRLVELDGVVAHPREPDELRKTLAEIEAPADEEGAARDALPALELARAAALRRLKAYRFLVGVPWEDLSLDPGLNDFAQAGAELTKVVGHLDHTPPNPGLPDDVYRKGYTGTSNSSLCHGRDLVGSVDGYMDDSDPSNIAQLGHRKGCLHPALRKTGFGYAEPFAAMWTSDRSGGTKTELDFIAYPPRGWVPLRYFHARAAWSVAFPSGRAMPKADEIEVRVYELDENYARGETPLALDHEGVAGNLLGFRPALPGLAHGARFWVAIDGLEQRAKGPSIAYLVEFVE